MDVKLETQVTPETLAEHTFLAGLGQSDLVHIAMNAYQASYSSGEILLKEGEQADTFYLIQQGKVALGTFVPGRGYVTLQTLGEGDLLGWSWLIAPYRWRFEALTITPVEMIVVDGAKLRKTCEKDCDFGFAMMGRVALVIGERLKASRLNMMVGG